MEPLHDQRFTLLHARNLHKWGFSVPTATVLYSQTVPLFRQLTHVIPCWNARHEAGLVQGSLWEGTRDYSARLSVPYAMHYLNSWRSNNNQTSAEFCHSNILKARDYLCEQWGTKDEYYPQAEIIAGMCMVKLPFSSSNDRPGMPAAEGQKSLRQILRDQYGVEAAVSHFEKFGGTYVRLSFAVYNTMQDVEKLAQAVLAERDQQG